VRHLQHLSLPIFGIFSAESVSKGLRFRVISAHFDGRHRCPPRASGTRAPPSATRPAPRPTILTISKRNDERAWTCDAPLSKESSVSCGAASRLYQLPW